MKKTILKYVADTWIICTSVLGAFILLLALFGKDITNILVIKVWLLSFILANIATTIWDWKLLKETFVNEE